MEKLLKRAEFLAVAGSGRKWGTPGMTVQVLKKEQDAPRWGLTASRHVGNAILRNKAKRRLRALIQSFTKEQSLKPWDFVLVARTATVTRDFTQLKADLTEAMTRLKALA